MFFQFAHLAARRFKEVITTQTSLGDEIEMGRLRTK